MSLKTITLASAAALVLASASFAATADTATTPQRAHDSTINNVPDNVTPKPLGTGGNAALKGATGAAGTAASKAATEVEKAVGAGDKFSADELKSAVPLSKVMGAKDKLASAKVDDMQGNIIGPVKQVMTGASGAPTQIHVDVGGWLGVGERVVAINASNFTYIPERGILLTKMSKDAIEKLPAVKS